MNKTILASCAGLALMFLAGASHAGNHKADIFHCGCNAEGDDVVWSLLSVSQNAGGHLNHVIGHETDCTNALDEITTFERDADDCAVEEAGGRLSTMPVCDPVPTAGDSCGTEVVE